MEIKRIVAGIYAANCYVVWDETNEALVVDPGGDVDDIYNFIKQKDLNVKYIFLTHGHRDHVEGVDELRDLTHALVGISEKDAVYMENNEYMFGNFKNKPDIYLKDGDIFNFGNLTIKCLDTPGHTEGGMSFVVQDAVFTGDCLFAMSIGRTDLVGGNQDKILNSIRTKLFELPENTSVYPGHSASTSIGYEKKNNPFFR